MEIHQLKYFLAVSETGSFSRAAEQVRVAQPSLSQQIKKLEEELGEKLFDRLARRVTLTASGHALIPFARRILHELVEARRSIGQSGQEITGVVRVGILPTILPFIAERLLRRCAREAAGIRLALVELFTEEVLQGVDSGDLDLGIISTCRKGHPLHIECCQTEPLLLAAPVGHPLARRNTVHWADLKGEELMVLHESNCLTQQVRRLCKQHGLRTNRELNLFQISSLLSVTAARLGLALIPQMAARSRGCRFLKFRVNPGEREINLVRNASRHQSRAAMETSRLVREFLGSGMAGVDKAFSHAEP